MRRLLFSLLLLTACDGAAPTDSGVPDDAFVPGDGGAPADTGVDIDGGVVPDSGRDSGRDGGGAECPRLPAAADRVRYVALAHPFGDPSYEVLALAADGTLSRTGNSFVMGKANDAPIVFTPDGEVGIAAQDDGSLGVFRLDVEGRPTVVHRQHMGDFYAAGVVMDPAGDAVWIRDAQWRESGGGVYRAPIGCDGAIGPAEWVAPGRLPYGMEILSDGTAVIASKDLLDETVDSDGLGPDVRVVDLGAPATLAAGEVFPESDWIVAGFTVTANERHAILGDNASFSATGNRIGVAAIDDGVSFVQQIADVEDPVAIVASPFDDAVIVVSGFGDAIYGMRYEPDAAMPLTVTGELTYQGRGPALPGSAVMVRRGALEGLVLISENIAVRRVRFDGGGVITDLGPLELGSGTENITGSIGVQP